MTDYHLDLLRLWMSICQFETYVCNSMQLHDFKMFSYKNHKDMEQIDIFNV